MSNCDKVERDKDYVEGFGICELEVCILELVARMGRKVYI